jgi:hypothetical protein
MPRLLDLGWTRLEWDSSGKPGGPYTLEVIARDSEGRMLDQAAAEFEIGHAQGHIAQFQLTPRDFQYGDDVNLSAILANTGSIALDGTLIVAIQDAAGNHVAEFRRQFAGVPPGSLFRFDTIWPKATLLPRNCRALIYAQYGGQTTAMFAGIDPSDIPLRWESIESSDGAILLRWASVAGRTYSIEFTPSLSAPFEPVLSDLPATPPINTVLDTLDNPAGFYRLREHW